MTTLTEDELEALTEASFRGGAKEWRAEVCRIIDARTAPLAAEQAFMEALADEWEARGHDWHWNSASRSVWLTTARALRDVLGSDAHTEQKGTDE